MIVGSLLGWLIVGAGWYFWQGKNRQPVGESPDAKSPAQKKSRRSGREAADDSLSNQSRNVKTVACQIQTATPGFFVLVDGEIAREPGGRMLRTPCEIGLPRGTHTLLLVQEKYRDYEAAITVDEAQTFEFDVPFEPFANPTGFFASPIGMAKIGNPIELERTNADGPAWDPCLSADGLSLWFAGQKEAGKGIYVAQRKNRFEPFGPPEILMRHSDRPASPTVTRDGLTLAYTIPAKAQVRSLVRTDRDAPWKSGATLRQSEKEDESWNAAQISGDGKTLYYTISRGEKLLGRIVTRTSLRKPFDGDSRAFRFLGGLPHFTANGHTQFEFDGEHLRRSTRANAEADFASAEEISEFGFDGYMAQPDHRQYCVSDDEQWLCYSDNPREAGKLYLVRIADGPQRGFAPVGKALPIPEDSAAPSPFSDIAGEKKKADEAGADEQLRPAADDPRSAPLAFVEYLNRIAELRSEWDYDAALNLTKQAAEDSMLAESKNYIAWDVEELQILVAFRNRLNAALGNLKPKEVVKAGAILIEFEKFEEGVVSGQIKGSAKPVSKRLADFNPVDLVTIVEKSVGRDDADLPLQAALFLAQFPKIDARQMQMRWERVGLQRKDFTERPAARRLHVAELEVGRDNFSVALEEIGRIISAAPKSEAAGRAQELQKSLYLRLEWNRIGSQSWDASEPGQFIATGSKSPGSYLFSPAEYKNFQLSLEWKTNGETAQGGVFFHLKNGGDLRKNAFKIHLTGDYLLRNQIDKYSTGSLFGVRPPRSNPVKPNGEWNTLELRVQGDRFQVSINGVEVQDAEAKSRDVPPRGPVALDGEFPGITYRNILVYELPPSQTAGEKKQ